MPRPSQRVVIDGEELNLTITQMHEEMKRRGAYDRGYDMGPNPDGKGGLIVTVHGPKEGE